MFIKSFGLFWRRDEVDWTPGTGKPFRLIGRRGERRPGIRLADFREQQGIYILYGNHGAYYVGLTENLGTRMKDHISDMHKNRWDRFSWFGFRKVLKKKDVEGMRTLAALAGSQIGDPKTMITDVEALLIRAMGLSNIRHTRFTSAHEWRQVKLDEIDKYLNRIGLPNSG